MEVNVYNVKIIDQWGQMFKPIVQKYNTPRAICGYLATAIVAILSNVNTTFLQIMPILKCLKNFQFIESSLLQSVAFIQKSRQTYLQEHQNQFTLYPKEKYLKDWVANFEIQDYLMSLKEKGIKNQNLMFVRTVAHDTEADLESIKHQQKIRIQQDLPFKGDKIYITLFKQKKIHLKKTAIQQIAQVLNLQKPIIYLLDYCGHFEASIAYGNQFYVLNTTQANYLQNSTLQQAKKLHKNLIQKYI